MPNQSRFQALGAALLAAAALVACDRGAETRRSEVGPAAVALAASAEPAPPRAPDPTIIAAPPPQAALATQEFTTNPDLRCDVLEVKRVSGGALLVKWRLARPPASAGGLAAGSAPKPIYHTWDWESVYFTDAAENKKYFGLRDSAGAWLAQGRDQSFGPGDRQILWMKFPAPPESSTRISFVFPGFAPFEDLPVAP